MKHKDITEKKALCCFSNRVTRIGKTTATITLLITGVWIISPGGQGYAQVPISFGQRIVSSIDDPAETNELRFEARAGDVVLLLLGMDTDLDLKIELYDPEGSLIEEDGTIGPDFIEIVTSPLSITGDYKIMVSGVSKTKTGDYWLYIQRVNNPGKAKPIGFGETISSSILEGLGVDAFTFEAQAGDSILVWMGTDSNLDPRVVIYAPDGSYIDEQVEYDGPAILELQTQLPMTGKYTLLTMDGVDTTIGDYGAETGPYWIFLQRTNKPAKASLLDFGKTVSGSILPSYGVDTFTFDALDGDSIWVRINSKPRPCSLQAPIPCSPGMPALAGKQVHTIFL
ncbi:MAG: hypothetical protein JRH06_10950 [Deltaproteobacteria bacterium]|nr:hypothetical protein [Deltaproteobacteria bacterium]MBW2138062.1 hypothetical protein [Deltaproteobacteria bacterium]